MADDPDFRNPTFPPRRISSSPDLREGVIVAPGRSFSGQHDWHRSVLQIVPPSGAPTVLSHSPVTSPESPEDGVDITEAPVGAEDDHRAEKVEVTSDHSNRPADEEQDQPAPTWDDFPPLPGIYSARVLSFRFWLSLLRTALGYEGPIERKENVRLFWKVLFDLIQVRLLACSQPSSSK